MALDDYFESEVAIAVAATAAALSPRVRSVLRQGAVYGLAGALMAGDALGTFARGMARGAQQAAETTAGTVRDVTGTAVATAGDVAGAAKSTADEVATEAGERARRARRGREAASDV